MNSLSVAHSSPGLAGSSGTGLTTFLTLRNERPGKSAHWPRPFSCVWATPPVGGVCPCLHSPWRRLCSFSECSKCSQLPKWLLFSPASPSGFAEDLLNLVCLLAASREADSSPVLFPPGRTGASLRTVLPLRKACHLRVPFQHPLNLQPLSAKVYTWLHVVTLR